VAEGPCVYINTSIVVRALNPGEPGHEEARRLLEECCQRCRCVWSNVHGREGFRSDLTRFLFYSYLAALGAEYAEVDENTVFEEADAYITQRRLSWSRLVDTAHMVAARRIGCRYLLARDSFMWRHANNFGLVYVNWETHGGRCPCPGHGRQESGSQASGSGGRGATRQENSSTSSSRPRGARSARRPGGSSTSGKKKKSASRKPGRGSKSSQTGQKAKHCGSKRGNRENRGYPIAIPRGFPGGYPADSL